MLPPTSSSYRCITIIGSRTGRRRRAWFTALARDLIDHGADIIAGTGAPVLQPISFHRGRPILAGLGNLVFHTHRAERYDAQSIDVWTGAICLCRFDGQRLAAGVDIVPRCGRPAGGGRGRAGRPRRRSLSGGAAALVFEHGLPAALRRRIAARLNLAA